MTAPARFTSSTIGRHACIHESLRGKTTCGSVTMIPTYLIWKQTGLLGPSHVVAAQPFAGQATVRLGLARAVSEIRAVRRTHDPVADTSAAQRELTE